MDQFKDEVTRDIYNGIASKAARRTLPQVLHKAAARKLDALVTAKQLKALIFPPGNRLEELSGDRVGQWSIRINDQYRICFIWTEEGADEIEIVDYH